MKACLALTVAILGNHAQCLDARGIHQPAKKAISALRATDTKVAIHGHVSSKKGVADKIVPPLVDVDTDKKFFGPPFPADYPDDTQPHVQHNLFKTGAVYPKVQEEGFFDKDFVKDENSDGGKWQAQSEYDNARTKIQREQRQKDNALKRVLNEQKEMERVAKAAAEKKQKEEESAEEERRAEEEAKSAAQDTKDLVDHREQKAAERKAKARAKAEDAEKTQEQREKDMQNKVDEAHKALEEQRESYQKCLEDLKQAKAKVEQLEKDKERVVHEGMEESKMVVSETEDLEEEKKLLAAAQAKAAAAEAKQAATMKKLEEAHTESEKVKRELEQEKAENEHANKILKTEEEELHQAEKDLDSSRANLRRVRGLDALPAGDEAHIPEPPKKSGAVGLSMTLSCVSILVSFARTL